jgi:hypothetical protein
MTETLWQIIQSLLLVLGVCLAIAVTGLVLLIRSIRRIRVPRDADFFTTMRYVPLPLVILLDLLDLSLDIFAAPIAWIVLDRMGLPNLRNKAAVEALIPFTGPIPVFTLTWLMARIMDLGEPPGTRRPYPRPIRRTLEDYPASRGYSDQHRPSKPQIIDMEVDER